MSLFSMLANAKTLGSKDGDFFAPGQQGLLVITKLIYQQKKAKQTAIIVGKILESHAKDAEGKVQNPGTKVKKVYSLSKFDWAIDQLKTDLLKMAGVDEKTLSPNDLEKVFEEAFGATDEMGTGVCKGGALLGVVVAFDTSAVHREGKQTLTNINFAEVSSEPGQLNDPAKVEERRKELLEEAKSGK